MKHVKYGTDSFLSIPVFFINLRQSFVIELSRSTNFSRSANLLEQNNPTDSSIFDKAAAIISVAQQWLQSDLFYDYQFGSLPGRSNTHALLHFIDLVIDACENKYISGMFLDLSKAFDTLHHNIFLSKSHHYGIRGNTHMRLSNYLSNPSQSVTVSIIPSDFLPIYWDVPQGSILGPLLSIIYMWVTYVGLVIFFHVILYAGDTNLFFSHR